MSEPNRYHYFLIVGEILFRHVEKPDIHSVRLNGVIISDTNNIPVKTLGKAQQTLQLNFHQKMQDEKMQVIDVILQNFVYLGHFTEEEFHQTPPGTEVQERPAAKPTLTVVPSLEDSIQEAKQNDGTVSE